jgi:Spy/CpxP family protein refolding chaperone
VAEHRARTNALDEDLRAKYRSDFRVILLETREAIKEVLTPEQAAEYQRLLDERDARDAAERANRDEKD